MFSRVEKARSTARKSVARMRPNAVREILNRWREEKIAAVLTFIVAHSGLYLKSTGNFVFIM